MSVLSGKNYIDLHASHFQLMWRKGSGYNTEISKKNIYFLKTTDSCVHSPN